MKTTVAQIIDTVERMREAQRQYFSTRNMKALTRAKLLEGAVDNMIAEYKASQMQKAQQADLFPDTFDDVEQ